MPGAGPAAPRALSRRETLRWGAGAIVAGTGAALAGCGRVPAATPQTAHGSLTLLFQPVVEGGLASARAAEEEVLAGFLAQNRGVRLALQNPAGSQANVAAIQAGRGPDVFWDFHYAPYLAAGALLRLDPYLSRDNVDPDIWSPAQMSTLRTATPTFSGTFALPAFFGTMVYAINLGDLHQKGAPPPAPGWTATDFVTLAARLSGTQKNGQRHYGASMEWYTNQTNDGEVHWLFGAFGGTYINGSGTAVEITLPPSLEAGRWLYEELLWPEFAVERTPGGTASEFVAGRMSMAAVGNWALEGLVDLLPAGLDFDFFPFPVFPTGRTTFGTDDFYAIAATTKHPEQAWALLRWLSAEPAWQQAQIRLQLLSPALNALWPQWVEVVQQATPALKGKAVRWFADAATGAYALPPQYFVAADTQAQGLMGQALATLHARRSTVAAAFLQAEEAINPLVAAAIAAAEQRAASRLPAANGAFAPPQRTGLGAPAQPATGLVTAGGGGYGVTGAGTGLLGTSGDACVFACEAVQEAGTTLTCRLDALLPGTAPPGASAGLMVRGDLSSNAPALALEVTAGHGVRLQLRPQARTAVRTVAAATPVRAPVWLQLQRTGLNWTARTSPDGSHWSAVGPAQPLAVAGCWAGAYATAPLKATFDHVDFTAQGAYRLGG